LAFQRSRNLQLEDLRAIAARVSFAGCGPHVASKSSRAKPIKHHRMLYRRRKHVGLASGTGGAHKTLVLHGDDEDMMFQMHGLMHKRV
jgi:hypothetical protein